MSLTDRITAYEEDQLTERQVISLFQDLVDSGMAWRLQGHYGRTANRLIEAGVIRVRNPKEHSYA